MSAVRHEQEPVVTVAVANRKAGVMRMVAQMPVRIAERLGLAATAESGDDLVMTRWG